MKKSMFKKKLIYGFQMLENGSMLSKSMDLFLIKFSSLNNFDKWFSQILGCSPCLHPQPS
jgi:hypothetical protein